MMPRPEKSFLLRLQPPARSSLSYTKHGCKTSSCIILLKVVVPMLGLALLLASAIQYISNNNNRMSRYEKEVNNLRDAVNIREETHETRMKRQVSESNQAMFGNIVQKGSGGNALEYVNNYSGLNVGGVTYMRWGRRDCPSGELTRLVYSGYMAASYLTHGGGGSNYLCLHWNVTYNPGKYVDGNQGSSYIYGVEYRDSTWMNQLFDLSLTETNSLRYHSVPCSMCLAKARSVQIMIPGREACPRGWHKEYTGYIMAGGHNDKHSTQFVCVDDKPHIVPGTIGDQKGGSLQIVETECASLLCEPFVDGRELRCVVCTL